MNLTQTWIESPWMKALGWTFVHSIWQIALIGLLLFIVLKCIPGRSAHTRYTISTLALLTTLIAALCTFIIMLPAQNGLTEVSGNIVYIAAAKSASVAAQLSAWLEGRMPMMLSIWFGGVAILMLRLVLSFIWVSHLRNNSFPEEQLQSTLNHIIQRLKINVKATTSQSYHINSPVTIGHLKPLILFPVGILNQLTPNEVEAVLTHEIAHIVRRDYLSNIIQSFIETLFYYHPVTWWISRMVRSERENRADDLAVSWCGDHLGYAKALLTIQEMQVGSVPKLAVGFASNKGAMLARIQRILHLPYKNHNQMEKTVLLCLCSLCFLAFTLTGQHRNPKDIGKSDLALAVTLRQDTKMDSIPTTGSYKIHKKTDDKEISIAVEEGDIKELRIDGKDISPADFDQYGEIIDELFGTIETPPTMEGFESPQFPKAPLMSPMPPMPPMPPMAPMAPMAPMPPMKGHTYMMTPMAPMPPMPDMSQLTIEMKALEELQKLDGYNITILNPKMKGNHFKILQDTSIVNGNNTIIIRMDNGDSSIICVPGHAAWTGDFPTAIALDGRLMNQEEMEKWSEEMRRNAEVWEKEYKAQANQWKEQSKQYRNQWNNDEDNKWRNEQDRFRSEQDQYRNEQERYKNEQEQMKELQLYYNFNLGDHPDEVTPEYFENQLENDFSRNPVYVVPSPRLSLSEQMVRDGLIKPGEEAEVQLTPDKLKINGHKVSDELHDKYLRIYERQQGLELTGNSRVEFTTKSKQHM